MGRNKTATSALVDMNEAAEPDIYLSGITTTASPVPETINIPTKILIASTLDVILEVLVLKEFEREDGTTDLAGAADKYRGLKRAVISRAKDMLAAGLDKTK